MGATFRLMTANLLHRHLDVDDFARVLDLYEPDVVVTQELAPEAASVLETIYPHHQLRPARSFKGRGIATRLDATFGDIDMPRRRGTFAVLEVGGVRVRLAGVHLLNPIDFPWWTSVRTRGRQLERLFAWADSESGPLVVAGDCNASPRWPAYKQLAERYDDVVLEWGRVNERHPERTWAWRAGWPLLLRIDHIFGSGVVAQDVHVVAVGGTDHRAVVADLEIIEA